MHTLITESHATGLLGLDSKPLRIYSSPSPLGFTDKFTAASAHFYFDEAAADPDDVQDESTFCMIGHDVWVLLHGVPRSIGVDVWALKAQ